MWRQAGEPLHRPDGARLRQKALLHCSDDSLRQPSRTTEEIPFDQPHICANKWLLVSDMVTLYMQR